MIRIWNAFRLRFCAEPTNSLEKGGRSAIGASYARTIAPQQTKTMSIIRNAFTLGVLLVLGACDSHVSSTVASTSDQVKSTITGAASVKFECARSNSSLCNYVVFTSNCSSGSGENGKPTMTCTHQVLDQFSLREGESKEISGLPPGVKHCTAIGEQPKFPTCAP